MIGGREGHGHGDAAHVVVCERLQGRLDVRPGELLARGQHPSHPFGEGREGPPALRVGVGLPLRRLALPFQILPDDARAGHIHAQGRIRHRPHHALGGLAGDLHQLSVGAPVEAEEGGIQPQAARILERHRGRPGGVLEHHVLGPTLANPGELRGEVHGSPRHLVQRQVDSHRLRELLPTLPRRRQPERTRVVHQRDHGSALTVVVRDPVQGDAELIAVGGGQQEVVGGLRRVSQAMRERCGAERNLVLGNPQAQCLGVARAPSHEDHRAFVHELAVELLGPVDLIAVVLEDEVDGAPLDAAPAVDPVREAAHAVAVVGSHVGGGPGEVEDGADLDAVVVLSRVATPAGRAQEHGYPGREHCTGHRQPPPRAAPGPAKGSPIRGGRCAHRPALAGRDSARSSLVSRLIHHFSPFNWPGSRRAGTQTATHESSLSHYPRVWTVPGARRSGRG